MIDSKLLKLKRELLLVLNFEDSCWIDNNQKIDRNKIGDF